MAELLGVVASGISVGALAGRIGSGILKLKSLYDQFQDAPEDIKDLIEQIGDLNDILTNIANDQSGDPTMTLSAKTAPFSQWVQHCQKAADRIKELTEMLAADLDSCGSLRRKRGSVKVVLSSARIERYKKKLEMAIILLSMSHQLYTRMMMQLQHEIVVSRLSWTSGSIAALTKAVLDTKNHAALPMDPPPSHPGCSTLVWAQSSTYFTQPLSITGFFGTVGFSRNNYSVTKRWGVNDRGRQEERKEITMHYRCPSWLTTRAWEIQVSKATSGWTFKPRTYNVIPEDSPLFQFAQGDDVEGLQGLFACQAASPYDCNEDGQTALHCAAFHYSYSACELLIELGADVTRRTHGYGCETRITSPTGMLEDGAGPCDSAVSRRKLHDIARLFHRESPIDLEIYLWPNATTSGEEFRLWQGLIDPFYYERPEIERVVNAIRVAHHTINKHPSKVRAAMTDDVLPSVSLDTRDEEGRTLLNAVVGGMRFSWDCEQLPGFGCSSDDLAHDWQRLAAFEVSEWRKLLKEIIQQGVNLHCISQRSSYCKPRTPLLAFLEGDDDYESSGKGIKDLLKAWLEDLDEYGVDLEEYGRTETELFEQGLVSWSKRDFVSTTEGLRIGLLWRLHSFTYGKRPSDWTFNIEYYEYPLAGHWELPWHLRKFLVEDCESISDEMADNSSLGKCPPRMAHI